MIHNGILITYYYSPNGEIFQATLSPRYLFPSPPEIGDVVTFQYVQSRDGHPLDAKILKISNDVSWDHVVSSFYYSQSSLSHSSMLIFLLGIHFYLFLLIIL